MASSLDTTWTGVKTRPEPLAFSVHTPAGPLPLTRALTGSKVVSVGAQKLDAGSAVRAIERTPESATGTVAKSNS